MKPPRPTRCPPRPARLAPLLTIAAIGCGGEPTPTPAPAVESQAVESQAAESPAAVAPPAAGTTKGAAQRRPKDDGLIADDGRTLWAPPTAGPPIDASLVPDGSDLVVWLRPAKLLATEEGRRVWRALGPAGERARAALEASAGPLDSSSIDGVDRLVLGVTAGESYDSVATTVSIDPTPGEEPPLLQREIEELLATSDADRTLTIVFSPRFLLGGGGSLVEGRWAPLRDLLLAQTSDRWKAAALSLDVGAEASAPLYWELRLVGDAATPPVELARRLAQRAAAWPDELAGVLPAARPHSAALLEASPAMARVVSEYARRGVDGRQAVLNGYLPPGAGHNLLLAAELLVAELASPAAAGATESAPAGARSLAERLRLPVTIAFERESFESVVTILSKTLAAPITIQGRDLQLEGITRNQMLSLDVRDMPAEAALVELLRRANPDPLAEGPRDPRQKLVYVVRGDGLAITTRSAAERRGEPLPEAFTE